ncbi:CobW family GTP-binding protein [Rhodococcus gannanensis]|uniref:CobW family GTP-binding protein n=1 Tax=Rhodococcus gannanensis TaxID=1960308 RepID=A0ABW4P0E9_9NOCA
MAATVTVLGGYLGTGKTTLLNGLLRSANGQRIAVVVNDFGSINIDAELIRSTTDDTIELSNGCVCCSLADGAAAVMTQLAQRTDLDHVVVELSGVAMPSSMTSWGTFPGLAPGPTVVCVDPGTLATRLRDPYVGDVVAAQLRAADLLAITHTDLHEDAAIAAADVVCDDKAPGIPRVSVAAGATTVDALIAAATSREAPDTEPPPEPVSTHRTVTLTTRRTVDRAALAAVLAEAPSSLVRAKGFIRTPEEPHRRTVVQYVRPDLRFTDGDARNAEADESVLVVIAAGSESDPEPWSALQELFD